MTFTTFDPTQTPYAQNNIVDNGGFEIWQRGASFVNPTSFTADRWFLSTSCISYAVDQETTNIDSGLYSAKCTITTAAGGVFRLGQSIENSAQYVGKPLSFSARVKSNIAGVKLFISYIGGQTASTIAHTGDNTWQTLTLTLTPGAAGLSCGIGFDSVNTTVGTSVSPSAGIYYVDSVMLVVGSNPASFVPLNLEIDLVRCQRFYEFESVGMSVWARGSQDSTFYNLSTMVNFNTTKRATPTITLTWIFVREDPTGTDNQAAYTKVVENSSPGRFIARAYKTVAGNPPGAIAFTWTASADI